MLHFGPYCITVRSNFNNGKTFVGYLILEMLTMIILFVAEFVLPAVTKKHEDKVSTEDTHSVDTKTFADKAKKCWNSLTSCCKRDNVVDVIGHEMDKTEYATSSSDPKMTPIRKGVPNDLDVLPAIGHKTMYSQSAVKGKDKQGKANSECHTTSSDRAQSNKDRFPTNKDIGRFGKDRLLTSNDLGRSVRDCLLTSSDLGLPNKDRLLTSNDLGRSARDYLPTSSNIGRSARECLPTSRDLGQSNKDLFPDNRDRGHSLRDLPTGRDLGRYVRKYLPNDRDLGQSSKDLCDLRRSSRRDIRDSSKDYLPTSRDLERDYTPINWEELYPEQPVGHMNSNNKGADLTSDELINHDRLQQITKCDLVRPRTRRGGRIDKRVKFPPIIIGHNNMSTRPTKPR